MKIKSQFIEVKGSVKVCLYGPDGQLKQSHEAHNLVVTTGKSYLAAWLQASSQAGKFMAYVGLGTGTTVPASANTTLETEFSGGGYSRQEGTLTNGSNTWTNTVSFAPGNGTGAVTEAGLFSAATAGTMFARQVFSPYNKTAVDTLTITWTVTFN